MYSWLTRTISMKQAYNYDKFLGFLNKYMYKINPIISGAWQ